MARVPLTFPGPFIRRTLGRRTEHSRVCFPRRLARSLPYKMPGWGSALLVTLCLVVVGCAAHRRGPQEGSSVSGSVEIPGTDVSAVIGSPGGMFGSWQAPLLRAASTARSLDHVAALLHEARPMPAITQSGGPSGLRMESPDPVMGIQWTVVFGGGINVLVSPLIIQCPTPEKCDAAPNYVVVKPGGVPRSDIGLGMYAPGLVLALHTLTDHLPTMTPLAVAPTTVAESDQIDIQGHGWVGPMVRLSLVGCAAAPTKVWTLGTAPVKAGGFNWTGAVGRGLGVGRCTVSAEDDARSYQTLIMVR